jgi:hypothetical protein
MRFSLGWMGPVAYHTRIVGGGRELARGKLEPYRRSRCRACGIRTRTTFAVLALEGGWVGRSGVRRGLGVGAPSFRPRCERRLAL